VEEVLVGAYFADQESSLGREEVELSLQEQQNQQACKK